MGFYEQSIHISLGLLSHQKNVLSLMIFCKLTDQEQLLNGVTLFSLSHLPLESVEHISECSP